MQKTKTISHSVFSSQILQNAEINIVVHWKFWRKYGSVSHLFSCNCISFWNFTTHMTLVSMLPNPAFPSNQPWSINSDETRVSKSIQLAFILQEEDKNVVGWEIYYTFAFRKISFKQYWYFVSKIVLIYYEKKLF